MPLLCYTVSQSTAHIHIHIRSLRIATSFTTTIHTDNESEPRKKKEKKAPSSQSLVETTQNLHFHGIAEKKQSARNCKSVTNKIKSIGNFILSGKSEKKLMELCVCAQNKDGVFFSSRQSAKKNKVKRTQFYIYVVCMCVYTL